MAWVYRKYATDNGLYVLENSAKTSKAGLWLDPHAIPPWEYRHGSSRSTERKKRMRRQMSSCKEAMYYMKDVDLYRLDNDKDGIPCKKLCR